MLDIAFLMFKEVNFLSEEIIKNYKIPTKKLLKIIYNSIPEISVPDASIPEISVPDASIPVNSIPKVSAPEILTTICKMLSKREGETVTNALIYLTQVKNELVRKEAWIALSKQKDKLIEIVYKINKINPTDTISCIEAIEEKTITAISNLLRSDNIFFNTLAKFILKQDNSPECIRVLQFLAKSKIQGIRTKSFEILKELQTNESVDTLISLVSYNDKEVSKKAIETLGYLEGEKINNLLVSIANTANHFARSVAIKSLSKMKGKGMDTVLMNLGNISEIKTDICEALSEFKTKDTITFLKNLVINPDNEIAKNIVYILGKKAKNEEEDAIDALIEISEKTEYYTIAIQILAETKSVKSKKALLKLLQNKKTRKDSLIALSKNYHKYIRPILIKLFNDESEEIRILVLKGLSKFNDIEAIKKIMILLADTSKKVRTEVLNILNTVTDKKLEEYIIKTILNLIKTTDPRYLSPLFIYLSNKKHIPFVAQHLIELSKHTNKEIRLLAHKSIIGAKDRAIYMIFLKSSVDEYSKIRELAPKGLNTWSDDTIIKTLLILSQDQDENVRISAKEVLFSKQKEVNEYFLNQMTS